MNHPKPSAPSPHESVLLREVLAMADLQPGFVGLDATLGYGGHCQAFLQKEPKEFFACDQDPEAISFCKEKFQDAPNLNIIHCNFIDFFTYVQDGQFDFIFADLGVSSPQLDQQNRGFSFSSEGPLDMRMNSEQGIPTVSELLMTSDLPHLIQIFKEYGDERLAKPIAVKILARRQEVRFFSGVLLAECVGAVYAKFYRGAPLKNPATKVFQALRIAVNNELNVLQDFLERAFDRLAPKGRICVISFHSLEDRIIKQYFQKLSKEKKIKGLPFSLAPAEAQLLKPFPQKPSEEEKQKNPRSRSALLRGIVKLG